MTDRDDPTKAAAVRMANEIMAVIKGSNDPSSGNVALALAAATMISLAKDPPRARQAMIDLVDTCVSVSAASEIAP